MLGYRWLDYTRKASAHSVLVVVPFRRTAASAVDSVPEVVAVESDHLLTAAVHLWPIRELVEALVAAALAFSYLERVSIAHRLLQLVSTSDDGP